jgi:hypothetical protein
MSICTTAALTFFIYVDDVVILLGASPSSDIAGIGTTDLEKAFEKEMHFKGFCY